ncbi:hypothetical protein ACU635_53250 [[Actinomadura] parvosata]|uniref:hypothetical protein n=1 Tax=[Actinomadura] parvosata TaxID=1955412 RepID=UPI00406C33F6
MNPRERAEAIKDVCARDWRDKKTPVIEKARGQQRLEFYREPDFIYDKDGQIVGVDAWVRLYGPDGREVRVDPHRRIVNPPTVPRSGVQEVDAGRRDDRGQPIKERVLTPDPLTAFYEAVWDSVEGVPNAKGWRTQGTVTTVFSSTADGSIESADGSAYSTARAGTGTLFVDTNPNNIDVGQTHPVYLVYEGFISFDTSSIPDAATVSAVALALWLTADQSNIDFTLEARTYDWGSSLTAGDWVPGANLGSLTLLASLATSGIGATGAYKTFASEVAFLAAPNIKTGIVHVMLSSSRTRLNTAPSSNIEKCTFSAADTTGTTQDPKLTITHAGGDGSLPLFRPYPNRIWRLH